MQNRELMPPLTHGFPVRLQATFARERVINDWCGISQGVPIAHPGLNIGELFVEFFRLRAGIENPEIRRGIDAAARYPLPVADIAGHVVIQ